jgi:hypothetical protein
MSNRKDNKLCDYSLSIIYDAFQKGPDGITIPQISCLDDVDGLALGRASRGLGDLDSENSTLDAGSNPLVVPVGRLGKTERPVDGLGLSLLAVPAHASLHSITFASGRRQDGAYVKKAVGVHLTGHILLLKSGDLGADSDGLICLGHVEGHGDHERRHGHERADTSETASKGEGRVREHVSGDHVERRAEESHACIRDHLLALLMPRLLLALSLHQALLSLHLAYIGALLDRSSLSGNTGTSLFSTRGSRLRGLLIGTHLFF